MSKIGISISIDVSKIDKTKLIQGKKGMYMDLTTFIDLENPGPYGDHGFITQSLKEEEREQGMKNPILGNCKVFFTEGGSAAAPAQNQAAPMPVAAVEGFDDDIPF